MPDRSERDCSHTMDRQVITSRHRRPLYSKCNQHATAPDQDPVSYLRRLTIRRARDPV